MTEPSREPSAGMTQDRLGIQVGRLALDRRWITPDQLKSALSAQARESQGAARPRPLGEILVEQSALEPRQLDLLLSLVEEEKTRIVTPSERPAPSLPSPGPVPTGRFGQYQLFGTIGRGSTGVIYEAVDSILGRKVALKMLGTVGQDSDEAEEDRLLREAKVLGALPRHRGIAGVYDSGRIDGKRYIALEFVEGVPMDVWMNSGKVPLRDKVRVLRDCGLALHFAHQHGLIHRDLKPSSILVDAAGDPHIVEFGLAVAKRVEVQASLTQTGFVVGTPGYMSPEQAEGKKGVDRRTDIYSLGAILFEMLAGRGPFLAEKPVEVLLQVVRGVVPRPSTVSRIGAVDRTLEDICMKALSRRPADRHSSAQVFAGELSTWLRRPGGGFPAVGFRILMPTAAGVAALVLVLLLYGARGSKEPQSPALMRNVPVPPAAAPVPAKPRVESKVTYEPGREDGLRHVSIPDGPGEIQSHAGSGCLAFVPGKSGNRRLYFDIEDSWADSTALAELEVECRVVEQGGWMCCEYDSVDEATAYQGTYRATLNFTMAPVGQWGTVKETLPATRFQNRQWGKADFRLQGRSVVIRRISIRRLYVEDFAVTSRPLPLSHPPARPASGLIGEYYADPEFGRLLERRVDSDVRFLWPNAAVPGGPDDRYSIRWSGILTIERTSEILFDCLNDDGVRIDVGGARVLSDWIAHSPVRNLAALTLNPGRYDLKIDFFDEWYTGSIALNVYRKEGDKLSLISPGCFQHDSDLLRERGR